MEGITNAFQELIELLVGGIGDLGAGIGTGVNQFVQDAFLVVSDTGAIEGLSAMGAMVGVFGGVSLAIGLTTLVFNWLRSLGN